MSVYATTDQVRPVRFGVVGTNPYAEMHLAAIASLKSTKLVAVCGRNTGRAREVAQRFSVDVVYNDYEKMITSGEIDAVLIIAPDALHEPITAVAAASGIHVVCEKPLAATADQAKNMCRAVDRAGVANMSFFVLRHTAAHRRAEALIGEGFLGDVISAEFSLTHGFFRGDNYDWRFDSSGGTGAIGDLGCYLFDLASWYVGDIERVAARSSSSRLRPHPSSRPYEPANDNASGLLAFRSGAHATFTVSVVGHQGERLQSNLIRLYGTDGTIEIEHNLRGGATVRGARGTDEVFSSLMETDRSSGIDIGVPSDGPHAFGMAMFVNSITTGAALKCDFRHGWRVQRVVDAALEAANTTEWVEVAEEEPLT